MRILSNKEKVWPKDLHTDAKHVILRKYLDVWIPKLASTGSNLVYIDGFAGPGEYENEETGELEKGSPIIALDALNNQVISFKGEMEFYFIEEDEGRCENLRRVLSEYEIPTSAKVYDPICGNFDMEMTKLLDEWNDEIKKLSRESGEEYIRVPTFVLIDPFGHNMSMHVIKRLMETQKTEILVTLVIQSFIRFCSLKEREETLNEAFACSEWKKLCKMDRSENKREKIRELYINQLKEYANIRHTLFFEMINKHNQTSYFLIFGTNSWHGIEVMKNAMWKVDPRGDYTFSDLRHPTQSTIMDFSDEDYIFSQIRNELKKLSGRTLPLYGKNYKPKGSIQEYISLETPYPTDKLKTKVLKPMELADPPEIKVYSSDNRRLGTYPDRCRFMIEFL